MGYVLLSYFIMFLMYVNVANSAKDNIEQKKKLTPFQKLWVDEDISPEAPGVIATTLSPLTMPFMLLFFAAVLLVSIKNFIFNMFKRKKVELV